MNASHELSMGQMRMMKPSDALEMHRGAIRRIVEACRAGNARVFGSVARGEDGLNSDLDLLVDPGPDMTLMDIAQIRMELRELLGVPVDVLTPQSLPDDKRETLIASSVSV